MSEPEDDAPSPLQLASTDDLLEELGRRFPAYVFAMQRDALDTTGRPDPRIGWDGPLAMTLGLADALQIAVRTAYTQGIIDSLDEDDDDGDG